MDDVGYNIDKKFELIKKMQELRNKVRRFSTSSEVSDDVDIDEGGDLLKELKERWDKAKKEEKQKEKAKEIQEKLKEEFKEEKRKLMDAIYKDKGVINQLKKKNLTQIQILHAREQDAENIQKKGLRVHKERTERLRKLQTEMLSQEDLKKRQEDLEKRLCALKERKQNQRESSLTNPRRSKGARRHQKKIKMGNQTPTDKELKENKELEEWERIYKVFKEEVRRRDSMGNFPTPKEGNVTQLKF